MPPEVVFFLDENHHRNKALLQVFEEQNIIVEKHHNHFETGARDEDWLPIVGQRGWILLTSDTRIRYRYSELAQVIEHRVRMFCFSSNNQAASAMAATLRSALPHMLQFLTQNEPPFFASIDKSGKVTGRNFPTQLKL
jgi:hypothetical protein